MPDPADGRGDACADRETDCTPFYGAETFVDRRSSRPRVGTAADRA